jgi:uncharacterized membrane protein YphA (DoxX/SURF4 family)
MSDLMTVFMKISFVAAEHPPRHTLRNAVTAGFEPGSGTPRGEEGRHMKSLVLVSQTVIALGLLNVWLLRAGKPTSWRGGTARSMKEEFEVYGLPAWFMSLVGFLKVSLALLLIAGLWLPSVTKPAAIGTAILMAGAVAMHIKVKDPPRRSVPALAILALCLIVIIFSPLPS